MKAGLASPVGRSLSQDSDGVRFGARGVHVT